MSKHKVVHLTSVHQRYDARIFTKECRSLALHGYEVALVVADNKGDEYKDGVTILDVGHLPGRFNRSVRINRRVLRKAQALNGDIYHLHDPELIPIGLKLTREGKRVVFDIHENTRQQILLKTYIPSVLRRSVSRLYASYEDYACKRLTALITPQEKMTSYYRSLNTTETVKNFADIGIFPERRVEFDKPVLFHAGTLSADRGLHNMVNAAKEISGDFVFYIAGKLEDRVSALSLHPLCYLGELNQRQVIDTYAKSNIGIILYNNVGQYAMASAVKCYEYMANSMPMILPDFGEWVEFNQTHQCGINVNVHDPKQIATAIDFFIKNPEKARAMGENGRKWVATSYSWQAAFRNLERLYQRILTA
jgi:glycosyltransferase involved in cell wall biosynthesis